MWEAAKNRLTKIDFDIFSVHNYLRLDWIYLTTSCNSILNAGFSFWEIFGEKAAVSESLNKCWEIAAYILLSGSSSIP